MQVPSIEAPSVQQEPFPGRAYPRFSEEAPEAAFGEPVAAGLAHAADVGVAIAAKHKEQNDQLRVIDAMTQLSAGHDTLLYGQNGEGGAFRMRGVDAVNMPAKFLPGYDDLASKISGTLTPDQQRMFQRHVATTRNELTLQLNRYEFQESERLAQQTFVAGQDQAVSSAALNYRDPHLLQKSVLDLHALNTMQAQREGWTPVEQHEALVGSIARMHAGVIDAMLGDGNGTAARDYLNQHLDELKEFDPKVASQMEKQVKAGLTQQAGDQILGTFANQGNKAGSQALQSIRDPDSGYTPTEQSQISAVVQHGLLERAESLRQDPHNQAQIRFVDDAISGKNPSPQALGTIESLVRRGVYTFEQGEVKRDELNRAQRGQAKDQADVQYALDAYNEGRKLDPLLDKGPANLGFSILTMGQKPGSDEFNSTAVEWTRRVGVMPLAAASWGRTMLTSGEPAEAAKAARLFDAIDRTNHVAYEYATDARERSMAYGINSATTAGTVDEAAVEHERELAKLDPARKKMLDETWSKLRTRGDTWDSLDRRSLQLALATDPHFAQQGFFHGRVSDVPEIPGAMLGEFAQSLKQYYYLRDGNAQQARDLAVQDLKRVWGVDNVNGTPTIMKYAPSRMYPNLPTADIREDMAASGVGAGRLQEFPGTGPSQGRDWWVMEPDSHGAWAPVLGTNGVPRVYQLPVLRSTGRSTVTGVRTQEAEEAASAARDAEQRRAASVQRTRETETAEEGGDIAQSRMPHF